MVRPCLDVFEGGVTRHPGRVCMTRHGHLLRHKMQQDSSTKETKLLASQANDDTSTGGGLTTLLQVLMQC